MSKATGEVLETWNFQIETDNEVVEKGVSREKSDKEIMRKIQAIMRQVCEELEDVMVGGGNIVHYHGCNFFPERWFDRVVVLQAENSVLYDRLTKRSKSNPYFFIISNNMECEIFQVLLEEARESYLKGIITALQSNTIEYIYNNVASLADWIESSLHRNLMTMNL